MQQLVACAIAIDDVRDIFGASPALAERLRASAAARFARPAPERRTWLRPLMRRDPAFAVDPRAPSTPDVDALLAGGYIAPERVAPSWTILIGWLEELSAATRRVVWDAAAFERIEWNLARAGLNSDFSLRRLTDRDLGIPLRPLPGQTAGYAKHVHVVDTLAGLRTAFAHPELTDEDRTFLNPILEVLEVAAGQPHLDVVVVGAAA
jgi:hypothetical protein